MDINSLHLTGQAESSRAQAMQNQLKTDYSKATDKELMDACKQFEAYFIEQVFKGMEKTIPESQFSNSSTSSLVDYYKDTMMQELASQTTESDSIGLAQSMYEQMRRNYGMDQVQPEVGEEQKTEQE